MNTLWIGHGTHRPAPQFPFVIRDNFFWHYPFADGISLYQYLMRHGSHYLGELAEFQLTGKSLILRGKPVDIKSVACAFFSWNCLGIGEEELERWIEIEAFIRNESPTVRILNSLMEFPLILYKSCFFERLKRAGFTENVPEYEPAEQLLDNFRNQLPYPVIIRSNMDTGGKNTYLSHGRIDAVRKYFLIKKGIKNNRRVWQEISTAPGIIRVRYYDNYKKELGCHASFRIFLLNGRLQFLYPHASMVDWCIHTDMKEHSPSKETFLSACDYVNDFVGRKFDIFQRVAKEINIHTLALDFLIYQDRPIFLEAELKYGCDVNFIAGPITRYGLDLKQFRSWMDRIETQESSFESFLHERP